MSKGFSSTSFSKPTLENWVVNIENMLKDEDVAETQICIHKIPQIIRDPKPEAYTPQLIGLGPFHHWREDLFEMEQCKLIVSKKAHQNACLNEEEAVERVKQLVQRMKEEEISKIRACYDRNLVMDDDCLAWMMVMDSIFLLQFLQVFIHPSRSCLKIWKRTCYLVDESQSAYHSIVKDIMKLENQIPMFVLDQILSDCDYMASEEDLLSRMLFATCDKLSPLKCHESNLIRDHKTKYAHLLELLYYLIVRENESNDMKHACIIEDLQEKELPNKNQPKNCFPNVTPPKMEVISNLNISILRIVTNSKPVKVIGKIAGNFTAILPSFGANLSSSLKRKLMLNDEENDGNSNSNNSNGANNEDALKFEEIEIPSVSSLQSVGIKFCPSDDDVTTLIIGIEFDKKRKIFYLPKITIDANAEVIIRNLVAYEAEAISGPSVLARYTELMNGIIDTEEDVKFLRESGIIVSYMKKDEDVAQLWNRMARALRLTRVPTIDEAIKEVNEYYHNKKSVRFFKFTRECMVCGWRVLMLLFALVLLVLMSIQSFCEVYKCPKALGPVSDQSS